MPRPTDNRLSLTRCCRRYL